MREETAEEIDAFARAHSKALGGPLIIHSDLADAMQRKGVDVSKLEAEEVVVVMRAPNGMLYLPYPIPKGCDR